MLAPSALAGQWIQANCQSQFGGSGWAGPEGWSAAANGSQGSSASEAVPTCAPGTPMTASVSSGGTEPVGSDEELVYTPPAGSTVAGGSLDVALGAVTADNVGGDGSEPYDPPEYVAESMALVAEPSYTVGGAGGIVFNCQLPDSVCNSDPSTGPGSSGYGTAFEFGATTGATVTLPSNQGGQVIVAVGCTGESGQSCPEPEIVSSCQNGCVYTQSPYIAYADVESDAIVLDNNATPAMSGSPTGTLLGTSQSPAHGTGTLQLTATDPGGPGVYNITVQIDGKTVLSETPPEGGYSCTPFATGFQGAMEFAGQQPCNPALPVDLSIDTTKLTDGVHQLKLISEDAAMNSSVLIDEDISVNNYTTASATTPESPAKVGSTGSSGFTGTSGATGTPITVVVEPPSSPAGGSGSGGSSPGSGGSGPGAAPKPTLAFELGPASLKLVGHRVIHRSYPNAALTLAGTVKNASGTVQPNAPITVTATPLGGGKGTVIAHTDSNGAGLFSIAIPQGDSRELELAAGTGHIALREIVTPRLSLRTKQLSGRRVRFSGRIAIAQNGVAPEVILEIASPDGWQSIGKPFHAKKDGSFHYLYDPNTRAARGSYRFRVITLKTPLWEGTASPARTAVL